MKTTTLFPRILTPCLVAVAQVSFSILAYAEKPGATIMLDPSLSQWDAFIGTPHKTVTGLPEGTEMSEDGMKGKPLGLNNDPKKVFSTFQENGTTVLKVSGEIYGGLTTKKEFSNYHFETDFKWGSKKWEPRLDQKLDSGILYHAHGDHGEFWNVWKASLEYQVQEGDLGDYYGLCDVDVKARVKKKDGSGTIHDPEQPWTNDPGYIGARPEVEEPNGEWNKLEIYVIGDSAIHVVNGQMVLSIADARTKNGEPLTTGEIQLQSEAAECYYRNMKVTPIKTFPKELAEKAGLAETGGIQATLGEVKTSSFKEAPLPTKLALEATSFDRSGTGYYLDKDKWLAINPDDNKTASAKQAFPFPSGRYDITLEAVGEEDGKSIYSVAVNDQKIGDFECPLSEKSMGEGEDYHRVWKNQAVDSGDIIAVTSTVANIGGDDYSRGRWARVKFTPSDDATKAAVKMRAPSSKQAPDTSGVPLVLPRQADGKGTVDVSGDLKQWHKVTLTLDGPFAQELDNDPNPFTDCNFTVDFTHESGSPSYKIPGYFAADGNAGESAAEAGTKWRAHLSPDKAGTWKYTLSFTRGKHAALDGGGTALPPFDGVSGTFKVVETDKTGRDFRSKGRLQYVGKHHLQFAGSKEYFLKVGADSPETLLAYTDFDNTQALKKNVPLKTWEPHLQDFKSGDPTWKNGKGQGLIGALNYLADKGVNSISFLTYNAGGDGDNIWPFVSRNDKLHWDCSKLDQWAVVLGHATARGLYLHFKLQENEIDDERRGEKGESSNISEALDGGKLGPQRKLYCREIIARFGHELALNWNIGEENTQTKEEINDMIDYIRANDPYQHHTVIHTFPPQQEKVYMPLLGAESRLTGVSLQNGWDNVHERTLKWLEESTAAGKPWVVANDEQGGADSGVPPDTGYKGYNDTKKDGESVQTMHDTRKATLWGNLMAGGAGVEYYFGYQIPENDLVCQDWRSRDKSWEYGRIALDFFSENKIPFWEMKSANALIGNEKNKNSKYCFAKEGELYLVYLPEGGETEINLAKAPGEFTLKWFNPRDGTWLEKDNTTVTGGGTLKLSAPAANDWLAELRKTM